MLNLQIDPKDINNVLSTLHFDNLEQVNLVRKELENDKYKVSQHSVLTFYKTV